MRVLTALKIFIFSCIIGDCVFFVRSVKGEDSEVEVLTVVEEGIKTNRLAIPHIKCRSEYQYGKADSFDDAMALAGISKVVADGYYATDGISERFDLIYPEELTRANERELGGGKVASRYEPEQAQFHNGRIASFSPFRMMASIRKTALGVELATVCPFDRGLRRMFKDDRTLLGAIEKAKKGELEFKYEGEVDLDGTECWLLRFDDMVGGVTIRYWAAPKFGFGTPLVKFSKMESGEDTVVLRSESFVHCGNGGWLPKMNVTVFPVRRGPGRPEEFRFRSIEFLKFQDDEPLALEDIALRIPKGVPVFDGIANFEWDSSNESLCPNGLFDLQAYDSQKALDLAGAPSLAGIERDRLDQELSNSDSRYWLIGLNGLVVVAIIVIVLFKKYS